MSRDLCLEDFPALKGKHVRIRDEKALLRTINRILKDGANSLQIVTDFDLTLTKQHVNGKKVLSSFGIFSKCKQLPSTYSQESGRLYKKYRPMEIDPTLPLTTKVEAMDAWMVAAQDILRDLTFDPQEIQEVAKVHGSDLRDGTRELFVALRDAGVPVVVFSAGLGDVVEAVLRQHEVLLENVKVISNFLKYEEGKVVGFANKRLIHVFNKNEHALEQEYFRQIVERKNILLMGDTIGDANMVDGMVNANAVLKIGFLYDHVLGKVLWGQSQSSFQKAKPSLLLDQILSKAIYYGFLVYQDDVRSRAIKQRLRHVVPNNVEDSLSSFMEKYDVVLIDDQTMGVPTEVLGPIL